MRKMATSHAVGGGRGVDAKMIAKGWERAEMKSEGKERCRAGLATILYKAASRHTGWSKVANEIERCVLWLALVMVVCAEVCVCVCVWWNAGC
jgi:hypothetical protein